MLCLQKARPNHSNRLAPENTVTVALQQVSPAANSPSADAGSFACCAHSGDTAAMLLGCCLLLSQTAINHGLLLFLLSSMQVLLLLLLLELLLPGLPAHLPLAAAPAAVALSDALLPSAPLSVAADAWSVENKSRSKHRQSPGPDQRFPSKQPRTFIVFGDLLRLTSIDQAY
jgi:hypothetical protein